MRAAAKEWQTHTISLSTTQTPPLVSHKSWQWDGLDHAGRRAPFLEVPVFAVADLRALEGAYFEFPARCGVGSLLDIAGVETDAADNAVPATAGELVPRGTHDRACV